MTNTLLEKLDLATTPISEEKLAQLRQLFPEAFTEGKIDFDALRRALGEKVDADPASERFGLRWPGKSTLQQVINLPSVGTLVPQPDESVDWDTTQNVIIEGDNLEVLKLLQKCYAGEVKMIYIDPPYNSGTDLIYPDDFKEGLQTYLEFTGQVDGNGHKTHSNTETNGRYHSNWLNMMYPRLYLARNLLREDGVIFVSIDDRESHNLRALMNDVFGEENFLSDIVRATGTTTGQDGRGFGSSYDLVIAYSRDPDFELSGVPLSEQDAGRFSKEDTCGKYSLLQLRKTGNADRRSDRPSMYYPLTDPSGIEVFPIGPGGYESRWRFGRATYLQHERNGLIEWLEVERNGQSSWQPYVKFYLDGRTKRPSNLWSSIDGNKKATLEVKQLFGETIFSNPKPIDLITTQLHTSTSVSDSNIVLDFFAGSGTTGHAVMQQNAEDGGNRRYIMVQLPEPLGEPKILDDGTRLDNIADICRERVRRAGSKVREDHAADIAERDTSLDIGFRAYKLAPSNFRPWDGRLPDSTKAKQMEMMPGNIARQLEMAADHLHPDATDAAILAELLLKIGIDLTAPVTTEQMVGKQVYNVDDGSVLICLERNITLEVIERLAAKLPAEIICLDAGFPDDQTKVNAGQIIAGYARDEETSIQFKVV
jgi:adenine-specific DNA-methyltransferase